MKNYTIEELDRLCERSKGLTDWQSTMLLMGLLGSMRGRNDTSYCEVIEKELLKREKLSEEEREGK